MAKKVADYSDCLAETVKAFQEGLVLLVSKGRGGAPNVMTIGWGTIGVVWGRPVFVVLVRPSRFTYGLIEQTGEFTVNVAPPALKEAAVYCGTVSGRDHDKFADKQLTPLPSNKVSPPIIEQCKIHFECKVVHKNDLIPSELDKAIPPQFYKAGDYHRLYYGEILACRRDAD
jgi:flavin reductase (DIM6/NTAB) family NADH-FMN oxidoreductase RutF